MKKITDKQKMISILSDDSEFAKYNLVIYYETTSLVPPELLDDQDVAILLIKRSCHLFRCVSLRLKNDRDFSKQAILLGAAIKYCTKKLRGDLELAELSVKHSCEFSFEDVSEEIRNNINYVKYALSIDRSDVRKYNNVLSIKPLSDELKSNREVADLAIKANSFNFAFLTPELQKDKELFALAMKCDKSCCSFLKDYQFKEILTKDFVLPLIVNHNSSCIYSFLPEELKRDNDIIKACFKYNGNLLGVAPDSIRNNKEYVLICIKSTYSVDIKFIPQLFNDDDDIFDALVESQTALFGVDWFSDRIQHSKEHMLKLSYSDVFASLPEELKQDEDIREAFGLNGEVKVTYYWYHGFYTQEEKEAIRKALEEKDYDAFIAIRKKNPRGLPSTCSVCRKSDYAELEVIDITIRENFMRITDFDSEAG